MRAVRKGSGGAGIRLKTMAVMTLLTWVGAGKAHMQTIPSAPAKVAVYAGSATAPAVTVSVSPASITVQPGSQVQFSAVVQGTINTSVVWKATGGTITTGGTYTAGQTTGTFSVRATLKNGTLFGKAEVTIEAGAYTDISPGESVQARINAMPAGTAFRLRAGTHRITAGLSPRDRNVFVGEAGAILSGARVLTSFSRVGSAWVASGQTQQGSVYATAEGGMKVCRSSYPRCVYPEDLFINNVPLQHVSSVSAGGSGKWFFDYAADQIYFWDDPAGKIVETSVAPWAFGGSATGVTIRGLTIEKFAAHAQIGAVRLGSGWILEDSEVRWNHFAGIDTYSSSIARRNKVHHNGCFGFHGSGSQILVEANEISYNGYAGFDPYWGSGGSKWAFTRDLAVRGNFSHHNLGPGLWTDINNIYTLYENNRVEDNERGGIFHEISYDAIIRYNVSKRNGTARQYPWWTTNAGIEVVSSRNVEVYGNTLEDNWQGITGLEGHRGSGNDGLWTLINLNVHDNTITTRVTTPGTGRTGVHDTSGTAAFSQTANNRYQQNRYYLGTNSKYFFWMAGERNETEWRSYGQDTTGSFQR